MYDNDQLKAENSKLRETLNKVYDFMKQFVVDGRNRLERFLESIGEIVEKVRKIKEIKYRYSRYFILTDIKKML